MGLPIMRIFRGLNSNPLLACDLCNHVVKNDIGRTSHEGEKTFTHILLFRNSSPYHLLYLIITGAVKS